MQHILISSLWSSLLLPSFCSIPSWCLGHRFEFKRSHCELQAWEKWGLYKQQLQKDEGDFQVLGCAQGTAVELMFVSMFQIGPGIHFLSKSSVFLILTAFFCAMEHFWHVKTDLGCSSAEMSAPNTCPPYAHVQSTAPDWSWATINHVKHKDAGSAERTAALYRYTPVMATGDLVK